VPTNSNVEKQFIDEESLLHDSYRLAIQIYESGFRPDFIVGVWRGGATVGIYIQECLQYLGVITDHMAIRTSYTGMADYLQRLESDNAIPVDGTQYLIENMDHDHSVLIVDDVYSTGRNIAAVINRLKLKTKCNMPRDLRVAAAFYKPASNQSNRIPDYYLHETDKWLVLPYELTGLSKEEIQQKKSWVTPILDTLSP